MTPEQKALADDIEARTAEYISAGGTITQLSWAGVPVAGETDLSPNEIKSYSPYGRNYPAKAKKAVVSETIAEWCNRVADSPPPPLPEPVHVVKFEREWAPPALPVQAAPAQSVDELCEYFGVPQALHENIADLRAQKVAAMIAQLRQMRREARHWQSVLSRLEAL